jgi:hypothetical protein
MPLPAGTVNPVFLHELALELGIPVGEMCRRMSAHELCVEWPAYFGVKQREQARAAKEQERHQRRVRR